MPITSRSFIQFTTAFLLVGFLTLIGIVGTTFWLAGRAQYYFEEVTQARDARAAAVELRNSVITAESSQRGFLFTGSEIYLAPFDAAKTLAQRQLRVLDQKLAPFPGANRSLQRLTAIIAEKFAEMDRTIAMKRDRRDAEVLTEFRTNRGKALMDEGNVFLSGIIAAADERLTAGVGEQRANATWYRLFSSIGGVIIVIVIGGAAITVLRYTRELGQARDEVSILNIGLEERVRARTAELARANEEIQRFVYIVTHDLRAPLINIMGFARQLDESVQPLQALIGTVEAGKAVEPVLQDARVAARQDLPEAISFIQSSTLKIDKLINAILTMAREGQRTLHPERVDLHEVLVMSAAAVQHQLSQAQGEIKIEVGAMTVFTDKLSLEQIFGNLLENAVKYRSKDRPLRIAVRSGSAGGDRVAIEIADNGRGIAEADQQRIFELFRRAGDLDQPGEGIGLAYVRTVVRNLGGEIDVTSELGKGTTFRVTLPRNLAVLDPTWAERETPSIPIITK